MDETLTGSTNSSQSGPGSYGNYELLHSPKLLGYWLTFRYCLVSYPGHSVGGFFFTSAEMESTYSKAKSG